MVFDAANARLRIAVCFALARVATMGFLTGGAEIKSGTLTELSGAKGGFPESEPGSVDEACIVADEFARVEERIMKKHIKRACGGTQEALSKIIKW